MAGMLSLKPEDEKRLHPEALKWFNAQKAEIQFEVPLEELSDDDLNTFLLDDEKREFQSCGLYIQVMTSLQIFRMRISI